MYRGESPVDRLRRVDPETTFSLSSKTARVTINSLRLDNVDDSLAAQKFVLKVSLHDGSGGAKVRGGRTGRGSRPSSTLLKLKGPRTEWSHNDDDDQSSGLQGAGSGRGIARFDFDTGLHSLLRFDLIDKRGFMCFGAASSFGAHHFPFRQVCACVRA